MKIGNFLLVFAMAVTAAGEDAERPATVKVAAVQCSSDLGAVEANLAKSLLGFEIIYAEIETARR